MTILFIDDINFHERGFPELFRALRTYEIPYSFHDFGNAGLKRACGTYDRSQKNIAPWVEHMLSIPAAQWLDYCFHGLPVFETARFEVLSAVMDKDIWCETRRPNQSAEIFNILLRHDFETLLTNMAASCFWIDFWQRYFVVNREKHSYLCIFGNSLTYTLSAAQIAERDGIEVYVFEHLFTGRHFFMEPRNRPQQGSNALRLPVPARVTADYTRVHNAFAQMHNKNVMPAPPASVPGFDNKERTLLLFTQVLNDFSLLGTHNKTLGSLAHYKDILRAILNETNCNIIVKTHPYEKKKTRCGTNVTYDRLVAWRNTLEKKHQSRIRFYSDVSLDALFDLGDAIITLTSQAALEGLHRGVPVCVLSDAFFARHGFTHDCESTDDMVAAIKSETLFDFTPAHHDNFIRFMTWTLDHCCGPDTDLARFNTTFSGRSVLPGAATPPMPAKTKTHTNRRVPAKTGKMTTAKYKKLVRTPGQFFADALRNKFGVTGHIPPPGLRRTPAWPGGPGVRRHGARRR